MESVEDARSQQTARCCRSETVDVSPFMPIREAANALGVCQMTIRRAFHEGHMPGRKIRGSYGILRAFVEAFIAEVHAGRSVDVEAFSVTWAAKANEGAA
jgi:excisionase family DNA binding protein